MKRTVQAVLSVVLLLSVRSAGAADDGPPVRSSVVVTVSEFRNKTGFLGCRLYKSAAGFPEKSAGTIERRVPVAGTSTTCAFDDLEPGTYAVSVLHDENNNQRLDKNLFGVPTEGYGASNNHTHALSSPSWEESRFVVASGTKVPLAIQLRY